MINLADVISSHIVKFRNNLYTTIPAIITKIVTVEIDGEQREAVNVSFGIDKNTINGSEDEGALTLPIMWTYASGWGLKMELSVGDEVLVHLSMRPTEEWLFSDGSKPVQTTSKRMHNLNDGFAVPCMTRYSSGVSKGYNVEIGDGKDNTINIKDGEVLVTTKKANIKLTGDGDIFLSSDKAKINITKDGVIELGDGASEPLVLGTSFMTLFNAHTHTYTDTLNPTNPVQITLPPVVPMTVAQLSTVSKTK